MPERTEWELIDDAQTAAFGHGAPRQRRAATAWAKWKLALLMALGMAILILLATAASVLVLALGIVAVVALIGHTLKAGLQRLCQRPGCQMHRGSGPNQI